MWKNVWTRIATKMKANFQNKSQVKVLKTSKMKIKQEVSFEMFF